MAAMPAALDNLGEAVRASQRLAFKLAVAEDRAMPFVLPYGLLGPFVVPTLWLAIPHARRPWLYRTRWLVVAFVIVFDLDMVRRSSSANVAVAYATGLLASWGIVATMNLLVWKRPQFEAARVMRRPRVPVAEVQMDGNHTRAPDGHQPNGLRLRKPAKGADGPIEATRDGEVFEYYWQPFPENGSFFERLTWAVDLTISFRFSGWNWSVSAVPRPEIPSEIHGELPVNFDGMPMVSKAGFAICSTEEEFFRSRIIAFVTGYLGLDFLSVFMMKDPYFIFGPDHPYHLPGHLQGVHPWLLLAYRQLFGLAGAYCVLATVFAAADLLQYSLLRRLCPGRGELWMFPSLFGSPLQIADRGLAGFWAGWWHQTFRSQFLAPAAYLTRHGYLARGTPRAALVALLVAFGQSGFLHASGSATSMPRTRLWRAPLFFLLQAAGIALQHWLALGAKTRFPRPRRWLARLANLAFALAWLNLTASVFIDDLSVAGVWLLDPVPASPLRWMGYGHRGDHWWRWDRDFFPRWHSGRRWWESGIAF